MNMKQPEYVYIGRLPCNCCVGVVNDDPDDKEFTAESVADFLKDGLRVERLSFEEYRRKVTKEKGFMNCYHGQQ